MRPISSRVARFIRPALLPLLLGLVGLLFTACSKPESLAQRGVREKILHLAIDTEPVDLDPHIVTGIAEGKVLWTLLEPLAAIDPTTLRPVPALAERWDISPDAMTYTFHLHADARWSNGDPVVAQDVIGSWRRILTPTLAADYAYQFYCIKNAEAFSKGQADFSTVGLAAPDAHTLRVTLARPTPFFLGLVAAPVWAPVHLRSIAALGDPYRRGTAWAKPPLFVGNGPFVLKTWNIGQRLIVEKSPTYWDHANVHLNAIHFYPIDNADVQDRNYRAGQLHATDTLPSTKVFTYRRDQPNILRADLYLDTYFFRFNVRRPPLDDARIRRALSLAIDREAIADKVLQGGQRPAAALVPPGLPDYTPPPLPFRDLALAKKLLAEAGYPEGRGLPPIELLYPTKGYGPIVSEAVQEIWHRDLGLTVNIRRQEQKIIFAERRAGNYQILLSDWIGDYLDPTTFLDLWRGESGNNHTGWKSATYDQLMTEAERTIDLAARGAVLQKAEALMLDAAPIAPVFYNTHLYLLNPAVKGWHPTPLDQVAYKRVWLE